MSTMTSCVGSSYLACTAVYVLDLCSPLLAVAEKRFAARGFKNVHCLLQDATAFVLPGWENGVDPDGALDFVTMSYSLR